MPAKSLSVLVQPVGSNQPIAQINADVPRNPASAIKLVTTWTALDLLGPTHQWPTEVFLGGPVRDGVLQGDLIIKGYGDPYLVLEDFWKLLGDIRQSGIREIQGDLVVDDSAFVLDPTKTGDFDGGAHRLYNVIPTAFTVNFNAIDFQLNSALDNNSVVTIPALPNLKIIDKAKRTKGKCKSRNIALRMQVSEANTVAFDGKLPAGCRNYKVSRNVMSPLDYAFGAFKSTWAQWGGRIHGSVRRGPAPPGAKPIVVWQSRTLAEVIRPVNKWSNNVMARLLLYSIGAARQALPISRAQGARALADHLRKRGLNTKDLIVDNGAGLSRQTRVTARFLVNLLQLAWREPTMPEFVSSLSIAGKDGTTRKRFRKRPESGRMHVKTGMLRDVVAIAGYVHAKSGKAYAVAMMLNHKKATHGAGRAIQDALLAWVHKR